MNRWQTIPRFPIPYGPADFCAALAALIDKEPVSPERLSPVLGPSPKFWTSSGRQALYFILRALRLKPGSGVAVPLYSDIAVANSVKAAGCTPVFVDVDAETMTMDPEAFARVRTKVSAAVAVHFFGHVARVNELLAIARGIPLIEDTVHAPGSTLNGEPVGRLGVACFYSFGSTKFWPAGGGGLAVINDPDLAQDVAREAACLRGSGLLNKTQNIMAQATKAALFQRPLYGVIGRPLRRRVERHQVLEPVLDSYRIHPSQAAVAVRQVAKTRERLDAQRRNSLYLLNLLSGVQGIHLPRERDGVRYNYHLFPIFLRDREEKENVVAAMLQRNIDTSQVYFDLLQHARRIGYAGGCPVSEMAAERMLTLPNYASLSANDIAQVATSFVDAVNAHRWRQKWANFAAPESTPAVKSRRAHEAPICPIRRTP
jgi:dTDP-4-amino-4,6-dideoxygalactose transaminase